jgi:iron complex outermembrane receptor protein
MRGITSDANSIGVDQSAGVYVDGVYMGRPTTINAGLYDIASMEILRGPQGTLYGRNTIGGAINIYTRLPGDEFEGELSAGYGNYNHAVLYGALSGPIAGSRLKARVAAQKETRDGFLDNVATGGDNNDEDNINLRTALVYEANEDLEVIFRGDWSKDTTNKGAAEFAVNTGLWSMPPFNLPADSPLLVPDDAYDGLINEAGGPSGTTFQDRETWGGSLEMNWDVAAGLITSITAYRGFDWNNYQTGDGGPFDIIGTGIREDQSQFSQEIRLTSPAGERFEYIGGLYYWKMNLDAAAIAYVGEDFLSLFGAPLGTSVEDTGTLFPQLDNTSYAAFFHGTFHTTDQIDLTVGARYTNEKKEIDFRTDADIYGVVPAVSLQTDERTDNVVTPMASLTYMPNDNWRAYGTWSRGFKAGGYNAFDFDFMNQDGSRPEFDAEHADNYEVGLRYVSGNRRVRVNLSAFLLDYEDLQVNQRLEDENGVFFFKTSNAAAARSKGLEFDFSAVLVEGLVAGAAYGYADATYRTFVQDALAGVDYSGNRLPYAPKYNASISIDYSRPVSGGFDAVFRGEYVTRGGTYSNDANTELLANDSYDLANLRVGLVVRETGFGIYGWVRNLFDEEWSREKSGGSSLFAPGALALAHGDPRTYGVELRYGF